MTIFCGAILFLQHMDKQKPESFIAVIKNDTVEVEEQL